MRQRRDASVNPGRWAVQRERAHLACERSPVAFEEPRRLADLIPAVLRKLAAEQPPWLARLQAEWAQVVGPAAARHSRPGRLMRDALVVFVDSSAWLQELDRRGRPALLTAIRPRVAPASVNGLVFRLDPDEARRPPPAR